MIWAWRVKVMVNWSRIYFMYRNNVHQQNIMAVQTEWPTQLLRDEGNNKDIISENSVRFSRF